MRDASNGMQYATRSLRDECGAGSLARSLELEPLDAAAEPTSRNLEGSRGRRDVPIVAVERGLEARTLFLLVL